MAAEKDEGERKQAEDKGVFFRFRDDLTVDDNPHRTYPSRRISARIGQIASRDANPHIISIGSIIIHEKMENGSVAAADSDGRRVRGAGGKSDVGSASARNSGSYRSDVIGIRAGKQGRELEVGIAGFVGVENVSVIGRPEFPSVSIVANGSAYSDVTGVICGRRTAKNPEGLVGGVVLAGIDVDEQLRIRYPPPQRQTTTANNDSFCFI